MPALWNDSLAAQPRHYPSSIGKELAAFLCLVPERPLHAHVARHNVGSIRVLEKCGFTIEREERAEEVGIDGAELVLVRR